MPIRSTPRVLLSAVVLALSPAAFAGPDIDEATPSKPDAGGTPSSARLAVGKNSAGGTSLTICSGGLATGLVSGDNVDMFVFRVWSTTEFVAEVSANVGFDSSIWLFRVVEFPDQPGRPPEAYAVAGNNAAVAGAPFSRVRFPDGGTQYPTGTYAVAITPRGVRPFGLSPTSAEQIQLFRPPPNTNGTGLMLPTPAGAQVRLSIWEGDASGAGSYALSMGGSGFVPAGNGIAACGSQYAGSCFETHPAEVGPGCDDPTCCATVCGIDPSCCSGAWDQACATIASQNCTRCGDSPPPTCVGDLNRDGFVNGMDLGMLLVDWGPCY